MKNLLSVQETADRLSIKVSTVRSWIYQKRLPVVRLGRSVRIRNDVLESIVEEGLQSVSVSRNHGA